MHACPLARLSPRAGLPGGLHRRGRGGRQVRGSVEWVRRAGPAHRADQGRQPRRLPQRRGRVVPGHRPELQRSLGSGRDRGGCHAVSWPGRGGGRPGRRGRPRAESTWPGTQRRLVDAATDSAGPHPPTDRRRPDPVPRHASPTARRSHAWRPESTPCPAAVATAAMGEGQNVVHAHYPPTSASIPSTCPTTSWMRSPTEPRSCRAGVRRWAP